MREWPPEILLLLLLVGCGSVTLYVERHDGGGSFSSSASSSSGESGSHHSEGSSSNFDHNVNYDIDPYNVLGLAWTYHFDERPARVVDRWWEKEKEPEPPPPLPEPTAWYKEVLNWTLNVPPMVLGMILLAGCVVAYFNRGSLKEKYKKLRGKDK